MKWRLLLFVTAYWLVASPSPVAAQGKALAKLIDVRGSASVLRTATGPSLAPVNRGMVLDSGYHVQTALQAFASMLFTDGRYAKLSENSALELSKASRNGIRLIKGKLWARFPPGPAFLEGPSATAFVHGTELMIEVGADNMTTVTVDEGEVQFRNKQGSVVVRDGQRSSARPGEPPSAPVSANLPVLLEWTNALLPPLVLLETPFVSSDPAELARAAGRPPAGREPRLWQADILHDEGRLNEALAAYDRAGASPPGADAAWEAQVAGRRGQTLLELGRPEEADAAFRQAVTLAGEESDTRRRAQVGLTMALLARGEVDSARGAAATAVAATPPVAAAAPSYLALALVEIRRGEMEAAGAALEQALAADPRYAQAYAWKSYVLRARGDLAGAREAAERAVALAPHSATCRQSLADVYLLEGRPAQARREAQQAVALSPLSSAPHVSLANAELLAGRVDAALREAHQGEALDPRSDRAQYTLGAAMAAQRRYTGAERHLRRAVELNPALLDARGLLGRVLAQQGQRAEALAVAQGTLERNPDQPSARAALGQVYRLLSRLPDAAREYEAALRLAPRNGLYHVEAARVYLDLNDMPRALAHAQQATFLLPGSGEAHAILGLVFDRQESHEQAVREYREAISLAPDNSLARLGLVTAFSPRSRELLGSGREQLRERAQALLRDPAVLQQTFEPGVTSELSGGLGENGREQQRYLHRGQFARGKVNDLSIASRSSDDGDRSNNGASNRLLQSDIAVQATAATQVLAQLSSEKNRYGLPGSLDVPTPRGHFTSLQDDYNLHVRHYLGGGTYLWLKYGTRSLRITRRDFGAIDRAEPLVPQDPGDLRLYQTTQHNKGEIPELRIDRRIGRHVLTYGYASMHLDALLFDRRYATVGNSGAAGGAVPPDREDRFSVFARDGLQYFQDDFRLGRRGALVMGTQLLRVKERDLVQRLTPQPGAPAAPRQEATLADTSVREHELLPYLTLSYPVGVHSLVRFIGNKTRLRLSDPLFPPSEAFIVGEPINVFVSFGSSRGEAENYELDYEHRFTPRTFAKLSLQQSRVRDYLIQSQRDQQLVNFGFTVPQARVQVVGLRLEHQINRYLSGFMRWSYWSVEDRTEMAHSLGPGDTPGPNPTRGLQVPFAPRWRGLTGVSYVDPTGTKASLSVSFLGRRFTDVGFSGPTVFGSPRFDASQPRPAIGPHALLDLRIAKEPSVRTEYGLTITNLFNTTYQDVWPGFPTAGRTLVLTFARRY
jgi:tetratricopeptide (TPR) repeat protein